MKKNYMCKPLVRLVVGRHGLEMSVLDGAWLGLGGETARDLGETESGTGSLLDRRAWGGLQDARAPRVARGPPARRPA